MIYDVIAYSKPADVPQNIGSVIKRLRVTSEEGEELDIVPLVNNFFADVDLTALTLGEPVLTLLSGLTKASTNEEVNDILGTLRYYGVYFSIIELPSLTDAADVEPDVQCTGYLLLPRAYKPETYSVPILYSGTATLFKDVPTVGIMMLEILKQLPLPNTFSKFTNVSGILEYYSNSDLATSPFVRVNDILKALDALGYSYLGLLM